LWEPADAERPEQGRRLLRTENPPPNQKSSNPPTPRQLPPPTTIGVLKAGQRAGLAAAPVIYAASAITPRSSLRRHQRPPFQPHEHAGVERTRIGLLREQHAPHRV
jgi:hypothetical protein